VPLKLFAVVALAIFSTAFGLQHRYDVVIRGGRVIDPETGVDRVMNVGITGGTIARIAPESLAGARVIDAGGLIVAPGFIDLHSHGQNAESYRLQALDGVTTALEMEIGVPDVGRFVSERGGRTLMNYGAPARHWAARLSSAGVTAPDDNNRAAE